MTPSRAHTLQGTDFSLYDHELRLAIAVVARMLCARRPPSPFWFIPQNKQGLRVSTRLSAAAHNPSLFISSKHLEIGRRWRTARSPFSEHPGVSLDCHASAPGRCSGVRLTVLPPEAYKCSLLGVRTLNGTVEAKSWQAASMWVVCNPRCARRST